jgi:hypothetical protein
VAVLLRQQQSNVAFTAADKARHFRKNTGEMLAEEMKRKRREREIH